MRRNALFKEYNEDGYGECFDERFERVLARIMLDCAKLDLDVHVTPISDKSKRVTFTDKK